MWLLPLLAIGLAVAFAGNRGRACARGAPPGPLHVLNECMRTGREPPPQLILCAIAEAEQLGRSDVAYGIVRTFIEPVVREHERRKALAAGPYRPAPELLPEPEAYDQLEAAPAPLALAERAASDVDLDAALELAAEMEREALPRAVPSKARLRGNHPAELQQSAPLPLVFDVDPEPPPRRRLRMPDMVATGPTTPIPSVPKAAWASFVDRLVREAPTYQSERHVGQYRQRKDRLAEVGIDYRRVLGDAAAQRAALDADLADAYKHALAGGMLDHVGQLIVLPGHAEPSRVTLSGMLGVIQAAGLDNAEGWLTHPKNRKRFPHTLAAYARTNGVF